MLLFSLLTTSAILSGSLLNYFEEKLPSFFVRAIRYGKFAHQGKTSGFLNRMIIEVPKCWFRHFYRMGVFVFIVIFYQATTVFIFNSELPVWSYNFINLACGTNCTAHSKYYVVKYIADFKNVIKSSSYQSLYCSNIDVFASLQKIL